MNTAAPCFSMVFSAKQQGLKTQVSRAFSTFLVDKSGFRDTLHVGEMMEIQTDVGFQLKGSSRGSDGENENRSDQKANSLSRTIC